MFVVTVIVEEPDPPVTDCGLNNALAPDGRRLTLSVTCELNALDVGLTVTVYAALLPPVAVWLDGVALMLKSPAGLTTSVTDVE